MQSLYHLSNYLNFHLLVYYAAQRRNMQTAEMHNHGDACPSGLARPSARYRRKARPGRGGGGGGGGGGLGGSRY